MTVEQLEAALEEVVSRLQKIVETLVVSRGKGPAGPVPAPPRRKAKPTKARARSCAPKGRR